MSELVVQYVQTAVAAATPWLAGVAVGFVLLWLSSFTREKKPFAEALKWFGGLVPWHRFMAVCALCFAEGRGLAQIDRGRNNANTSEIYDWHQNVDAMRAKLQEASNNTMRFIGYYSSAY